MSARRPTPPNRIRARRLADEILQTGTVRVDDVVRKLEREIDAAEARRLEAFRAWLNSDTGAREHFRVDPDAALIALDAFEGRL